MYNCNAQALRVLIYEVTVCLRIYEFAKNLPGKLALDARPMSIPQSTASVRLKATYRTLETMTVALTVLPASPLECKVTTGRSLASYA